MNRIGKIWKSVCQAAEDADTATLLASETYAFHPLLKMTVYEPKKREINYAQPCDRKMLSAAHAVLAPRLARKISPFTFSSIKKRGLHACARRTMKLARGYRDGCYLQIDIEHYYQSILHAEVKQVFRNVIKDKPLLRFLDKMIDNHDEGVAIGLALSAYVANLYLDDIVRWLSEDLGLPVSVYMDDFVIFFDEKERAHSLLPELRERLAKKGLNIKPNCRIAPVRSGIIFIGLKFYPTHTLLRKNVRERMKEAHRRLVKRNASDEEYKRRMAGYFGWCMLANGVHLLQKTMGERYRLFENNVKKYKMKYQKLKDKKAAQNWFGLAKDLRVSIRSLIGKEVIVFESKEVEVFHERKAAVRFAYPAEEEKMYYTITRSEVIMDRLKKDAADFPALVTFKEVKGKNGRLYVAYE